MKKLLILILTLIICIPSVFAEYKFEIKEYNIENNVSANASVITYMDGFDYYNFYDKGTLIEYYNLFDGKQEEYNIPNNYRINSLILEVHSVFSTVLKNNNKFYFTTDKIVGNDTYIFLVEFDKNSKTITNEIDISNIDNIIANIYTNEMYLFDSIGSKAYVIKLNNDFSMNRIDFVDQIEYYIERLLNNEEDSEHSYNIGNSLIANFELHKEFQSLDDILLTVKENDLAIKEFSIKNILDGEKGVNESQFITQISQKGNQLLILHNCGMLIKGPSPDSHSMCQKSLSYYISVYDIKEDGKVLGEGENPKTSVKNYILVGVLLLICLTGLFINFKYISAFKEIN